MKVPQIEHGVLLNGKEITTPLGVPRAHKMMEIGVRYPCTNKELLLDPSKPGYIVRIK